MDRFRVALISISLNPNYWQYLSPMFESAKKHFLKGHEVDYLAWTDMPLDAQVGATKLFAAEPAEWPAPTLFRYSLFLDQKDFLSEYDFIFYCDADMLFVSPIGDEVLGEGLTLAQHPMYALRREYTPPYEPDIASTAFIPRLGRVINTNGKKRFEPLYLAGGFQGGRSDSFIEAMEVMKKDIDVNFHNNKIAIWNDESHWNAYNFLHNSILREDGSPSGIVKDGTVVLNPSFIYPDSLNKDYYQKVWGRNYVPKLITLTKKFSLTTEGGANLQARLGTY